jgi:glucose-1-phosphate cytidylyltransferase
VLEPQVIDYIADDSTVWERDPLQRLACNNALAAYKHRGFWQPMDTLRDKLTLEALWTSGDAPWSVWERRNVNRSRDGSPAAHVAPELSPDLLKI